MRGTWMLERARAAAHVHSEKNYQRTKVYWTHSWHLDYSGIGADLGVEVSPMGK